MTSTQISESEVGTGTMKYQKLQPLFWKVSPHEIEGELRPILKVRSIFDELPSQKQHSAEEDEDMKRTYLHAILIQTFMAGVQALDMDEMEKAYRAIPRHRIPSLSPIRGSAAAKSVFIRESNASLQVIDSLLDFWRQLFLDIKGGLDVMEGLEHSYVAKHQWKAEKLMDVMIQFDEKFDGMCVKICGISWTEFKCKVDWVITAASETKNFHSRIDRIKYHKRIESITRLVSIFLKNHDVLRRCITRWGMKFTENYNDFVFMMRDRVKYNDMFKAVFLQAVSDPK